MYGFLELFPSLKQSIRDFNFLIWSNILLGIIYIIYSSFFISIDTTVEFINIPWVPMLSIRYSHTVWMKLPSGPRHSLKIWQFIIIQNNTGRLGQIAPFER